MIKVQNDRKYLIWVFIVLVAFVSVEFQRLFKFVNKHCENNSLGSNLLKSTLTSFLTLIADGILKSSWTMISKSTNIHSSTYDGCSFSNLFTVNFVEERF